jgi:hypothetical protein
VASHIASDLPERNNVESTIDLDGLQASLVQRAFIFLIVQMLNHIIQPRQGFPLSFRTAFNLTFHEPDSAITKNTIAK